MYPINNSFSSKSDDADFVGQTNSHKDRSVLAQSHPKMPSDDNSGLSYVYNTETSAAKTILITNNYSRAANNSIHNEMDATGNNIKKSSITIYTHNSDSEGQAYDRINILINNHYDRPVKKEFDKDAHVTNTVDLHPTMCTTKIKTEKEDMTEMEKNNATVVTDGNDMAIDSCRPYLPIAGDDVLVPETDGCFYLGTVQMVTYNKCLVRFDDGTEKWTTVGDVRKLNVPSKLPVCVACKKVNDSAVVLVCDRCLRGYHRECNNGSQDSAGIFYCKRCETENKHRHIENSANGSPHDSGAATNLNPLPYDILSLTWDIHHRKNKEEKYCYCGKNGKWYSQMLQCARCLQWFHQSCTKSLTYPLYFGDRFYLFACANCNHGEEFVRRLEMKIEDVAHLLLFNLWIHHNRRSYHFSNVIVPYARENWLSLQLTPKLKNMMNVKEAILTALKAHTMRFKSGKEGKGLFTHWSLKSRTPPQAPVIALPPGPPLSEKYLNDLFSDQARIHFLPNNKPSSTVDYVANDVKTRNIMSGKNFTNFIQTCDNDSSSSDNESGENVSASDEELFADLIERNAGINQRLKDSQSTIRAELDDGSLFNNSSDYTFSGFEGFSVNDTDKKKAKHLTNATNMPSKRGRFRAKPEHRPVDLYDSSDDTSSRGTLDSIIPPPKDFRGRNNPFINDDDSRPQTSTPKNGTSVISALFGNGSAAFRPDNGMRMVRTVKRRLSAKDIRIGPNMEVKRRKLKRRSDLVEVISTVALEDLPKQNAYLPIRGDSKHISAIRSSFNSGFPRSNKTPVPHQNGLKQSENDRRLVDKTSDNSASKSLFSNDSSSSTMLPTTSSLANIPGSPIKSENQDMADLKSTVNQYFGTANRFASGENFLIKGKRLSMDGRVQYLIEWDGV